MAEQDLTEYRKAQEQREQQEAAKRDAQALARAHGNEAAGAWRSHR